MITPNRCSLCPGSNACIPPDGPDDADVLFIGEAPGFQEDRNAKKNPPGRPFIGRTGEEVDGHYLPLAGLRRASVSFTNAIRCFPISAGGKLDPARAKDTALLQNCAECHLYPLIERARPHLLVPLGSFACRALGLDRALDIGHGIPCDTPWGIPAFPMFHPALGMHEPKRMLHIRNDWQRLKSYLAGRLVLPVDDYAEVEDYQEITHVSQIELDPTRPLAGDTESTRKREPYCFTYSQSAGTGRLIRADRPDLLAEVAAQFERWESDILFHNWLYDWPITETMGLSIPPHRVVDTMARAFHLGNLPQGLKALAYRELGMEMEDFEDVVAPYSRENILLYYRIAASFEWERPPEELVQDDKTGLWKVYKPQSMSTKFKRFFTDYEKAPETKDVFGMWEAWESQQTAIEEKVGPYPGMCISHVPFEKTIRYACRDVDSLIRLWPLLKRMSSNVRHTSQERWRD